MYRGNPRQGGGQFGGIFFCLSFSFNALAGINGGPNGRKFEHDIYPNVGFRRLFATCPKEIMPAEMGLVDNFIRAPYFGKNRVFLRGNRDAAIDYGSVAILAVTCPKKPNRSLKNSLHAPLAL